MTEERDILTWLRLAKWRIYAVLLVPLALLYFVVLYAYGQGSLLDALLDTAANLVPIFLGGYIARAIIRKAIWPLAPGWQLPAHIALAVVYALFNFWLLMVLLGVVSERNATVFSVTSFFGPAAAWQLLQGFVIYMALTALVYLELVLNSHQHTGRADRSSPADSSHFIRLGDDIQPLDPQDIILASGAGDYAEIQMQDGKKLIRKTLNELETLLGKGFLRIHRSHIVNLNQIMRMEPAGNGRMTLHLRNGESVISSRAGAKALRGKIV